MDDHAPVRDDDQAPMMDEDVPDHPRTVLHAVTGKPYVLDPTATALSEDNRTICRDHFMRKCLDCKVDYSIGESDEEYDFYALYDSPDESENEETTPEVVVSEYEDAADPYDEENLIYHPNDVDGKPLVGVKNPGGDGEVLEEDLVPIYRFPMRKSHAVELGLMGENTSRWKYPLFTLFAAHFTPQWDEEILGQGNIPEGKQDWIDTPQPQRPEPLSSIGAYYCPSCQVVWLVGEKGDEAVQEHPSHPSCSFDPGEIKRSMLVFAHGFAHSDIEGGMSVKVGDGATGDGGGVGVYFGPGSKFNFSARLEHSRFLSNRKASFEAIIRAMIIVRMKVLHERRRTVDGSKRDRWPTPQTLLSKDTKFRLIIVVDCYHVVDYMCRVIKLMQEGHGGVLLTLQGNMSSMDGALALRLQKETEKLRRIGVRIAYHWVQNENQAAVDLARGAAK